MTESEVLMDRIVDAIEVPDRMGTYGDARRAASWGGPIPGAGGGDAGFKYNRASHVIEPTEPGTAHVVTVRSRLRSTRRRTIIDLSLLKMIAFYHLSTRG
jgi:hypothetical protein